MKIIFIVFVSIFFSNVAFSQKSKNKEIVYDRLFTKTTSPPEFRGDLANYFDSVFIKAKLPNKGRVIVEVIIDSLGGPHYKNLYDHTNGDVSNLKLDQIIDKMPFWNPANMNGHTVNFILIVLLDFLDGKIVQVANKNIDDEMKYMLNTNPI